jgi:hypothetical protein
MHYICIYERVLIHVLCMYICMYVCTHIHIYIHICTQTYVDVYIIYICTMYVCNICIILYLWIHMYIYVYKYEIICVCRKKEYICMFDNQYRIICTYSHVGIRMHQLIGAPEVLLHTHPVPPLMPWGEERLRCKVHLQDLQVDGRHVKLDDVYMLHCFVIDMSAALQFVKTAPERTNVRNQS